MANLPPHGEPARGNWFTPRDWQRVYLRPRIRSYVARQFARLYYANVDSTVFASRFLGVQTLKYPTDLWSYQEIVVETLPEVIVETGTWHGGSALFLATVCQAIDHGQVISIDPDPGQPLPQHPRITYLRGSSTDPDVFAQVRELSQGRRIMVILDADHSRDHVLRELELYSDLVPVGGYVVAEDTCVNGHPVLRDHGPGPWEAVQEFLARDPRYVVDSGRERMLITQNPGGFLRRVR